MKKAQGISMRFIIIAALAMIVLLVMIIIFSGRIKLFEKGAENCIAKGGKCYNPDEGACGGAIFQTKDPQCTKEGKEYCCMKFVEEEED